MFASNNIIQVKTKALPFHLLCYADTEHFLSNELSLQGWSGIRGRPIYSWVLRVLLLPVLQLCFKYIVYSSESSKSLFYYSHNITQPMNTAKPFPCTKLPMTRRTEFSVQSYDEKQRWRCWLLTFCLWWNKSH